MELETINKLYLELSQITTATTAREILLQKQLAEAQRDSERLKNDAAIFYEAAAGLLATNDTLRTQLAEAKRDAEVNRQINRACAELPDDYCIAIKIERDADWVCLLRGGEDVDFDDPCEDIASSISAAIDAAKGEPS